MDFNLNFLNIDFGSFGNYLLRYTFFLDQRRLLIDRAYRITDGLIQPDGNILIVNVHFYKFIW